MILKTSKYFLAVMSGAIAATLTLVVGAISVMLFLNFQLSDCGCINFALDKESPEICSCLQSFVSSLKFNVLLIIFGQFWYAYLSLFFVAFLFSSRLLKAKRPKD